MFRVVSALRHLYPLPFHAITCLQDITEKGFLSKAVAPNDFLPLLQCISKSPCNDVCCTSAVNVRFAVTVIPRKTQKKKINQSITTPIILFTHAPYM